MWCRVLWSEGTCGVGYCGVRAHAWLQPIFQEATTARAIWKARKPCSQTLK